MAILGQEVPEHAARGGRPGRRDRGEPAVLPALHRPGHAVAARRRRRRAGSAGSTEVLELVGLRDRAKERVKTYSLGMKQRLAVASALLKEPEAADPRRAGQRAGPRRHPGDAHADAQPRRVRDDRGAVQPHPRRDPADLRLGHDHLGRPAGGRRPGRGGARPAHRPARCGSGSEPGVDLRGRRRGAARAGARVDRRARPPDGRPTSTSPAWITRMLAAAGHLRQRAGPGRGRPGERLPRADRHRAGRGRAPPGGPVRGGARHGHRAGGDSEPLPRGDAPAGQAPVHPLSACSARWSCWP